jgi:hypothetical protein
MCSVFHVIENSFRYTRTSNLQKGTEKKMSNDPYRDDINGAIRETYWTFWKILPLILIIIVVFSVLGFAIHSLFLVGKTKVERKVFENSYQRQEALKSEIAVNEAALIEIERKLMNPELDKNTRHNLEAQASAARFRIRVAKRKLNQ